MANPLYDEPKNHFCTRATDHELVHYMASPVEQAGGGEDGWSLRT